MKKLIYIAGIMSLAALASCEKQEIDNWYSEVYDYSGRFTVRTVAEGFDPRDPRNTKYYNRERASEVQIYNTAADIADEIWLDYKYVNYPFKGKFKVTGTPTSFSSSDVSPSETSRNYLIYNPDDDEWYQFVSDSAAFFPEITAAGQTAQGRQLHTSVELLEGKIISLGTITPGGNVADSIYLSVKLHSDDIQFISIELDPLIWEDPDVPEYEWQIDPGSNQPDAALDEQWIIGGYRFTGYPEDITW